MDDIKSVELAKRGAALGDPYNSAELAWHYENAAGVKKNYQESFRLYNFAANNDNFFSQGKLGSHYENGKGVEINLVEAFKWYSIGADNGDENSKEYLNKFTKKYPLFSNKIIAENNELEKKVIEKKLNKNIFDAFENKKTKINQINREDDKKIKLIPIEEEYIVIKKTTVRSSPSSGSSRIKLLGEGEIIYIPGKIENWFAVEDELGIKIGYVFENSIKPLSSEESDFFYDIDWGNYFALIIGNNDYKNFDKLETPIVDAEAISKTLKETYNFKTEILENATRDQILDKLYEYRSILNENDNFLIYYAGHGSEDESSSEGYWQPVGSKKNKPSSWISNSEILTNIRALKAKHILIIVDSCFSGAILRTKGSDNKIDLLPKDKLELEKFYKKKNKKISRVAITSGNLEPVPDSINNSRHSPFAKSLIEILNDNGEIMLSSALFVKLETYLTQYSNFQETLYSPLAIEDHNYGGHFIFVPE